MASHGIPGMVSCMGATLRKIYSSTWSVPLSQGSSSVVITFALPGYMAKVVLLVEDLANVANGLNCLSGEYIGGSIYGNSGCPNIFPLYANIKNNTAGLNIGTVTYTNTTITIPITAAVSGQAGSMQILVEIIGQNTNVPSLTKVEYPIGTTVYTPGY